MRHLLAILIVLHCILCGDRLVALPPVVDLSQDTQRQVIIAQGTADVYQGHPTTLLMPDGKTMFCVWTHGHGGTAGPLKRSDDGGLTWSEELPVPENWWQVRNCPAIYRLTDPQGVARLIVYAGQGPDGTMQQSVSTDEGKTWSPMQSNGLVCVMPFCTIVSVDGGKKLIGLTNIRRPGETQDPRSNIIAQSESVDGGLTWSDWRILLDLKNMKPCEPELVRSPAGKQLLCLMRENVRRIGRPMALRQASAERDGSRGATAGTGRAGCGPIVEVPRSVLSTLKARFVSSAQTGLETALLTGRPHRGMGSRQRLRMSITGSSSGDA